MRTNTNDPAFRQLGCMVLTKIPLILLAITGVGWTAQGLLGAVAGFVIGLALIVLLPVVIRRVVSRGSRESTGLETPPGAHTHSVLTAQEPKAVKGLAEYAPPR